MTEAKHETPLSAFSQNLLRHLEDYGREVLAERGSLPAVPVLDVVEPMLRSYYAAVDKGKGSDYDGARYKYAMWTSLQFVLEKMKKEGIVFARGPVPGYGYDFAETFSELKPVPDPDMGELTRRPD